jgi:hypothetical protein
MAIAGLTKGNHHLYAQSDRHPKTSEIAQLKQTMEGRSHLRRGGTCGAIVGWGGAIAGLTKGNHHLHHLYA